MGRTMVVVKTF